MNKGNDIKRLAEEMKNSAGRDIKQSDMLWYLIGKVDDINIRLGKTVTQDMCKETRASSNSSKSIFISICAVVISAVATVLNFLK